MEINDAKDLPQTAKLLTIPTDLCPETYGIAYNGDGTILNSVCYHKLRGEKCPEFKKARLMTPEEYTDAVNDSNLKKAYDHYSWIDSQLKLSIRPDKERPTAIIVIPNTRDYESVSFKMAVQMVRNLGWKVEITNRVMYLSIPEPKTILSPVKEPVGLWACVVAYILALSGYFIYLISKAPK